MNAGLSGPVEKLLCRCMCRWYLLYAKSYGGLRTGVQSSIDHIPRPMSDTFFRQTRWCNNLLYLKNFVSMVAEKWRSISLSNSWSASFDMTKTENKICKEPALIVLTFGLDFVFNEGLFEMFIAHAATLTRSTGPCTSKYRHLSDLLPGTLALFQETELNAALLICRRTEWQGLWEKHDVHPCRERQSYEVDEKFQVCVLSPRMAGCLSWMAIWRTWSRGRCL